MSRTIERPEWRPENGLTVSVESLAVTAVSLVATPAGDRPIEIHLADCFGRDDAAFSLADRALIESAIADAMDREGRLSVTFPMPAQPQSWWHNLKLKEGAFAAYVWLDDTTTLQQLLCKTGRYRPSHPQQSAVVYRDKPAPQSRPMHGLTSACKVLTNAFSADSWWIQLGAGVESKLNLIDCYTDPLVTTRSTSPTQRAKDAYLNAAKLIDQAPAIAVTFPEPIEPHNWVSSLTENDSLAGWLWLNKRDTLNDVLVSRALATKTKSGAISSFK